MSRPPIAQPLPFDISNWSFRGMDCEGWNFSGRDIRGCDFRNAKLKGANFSGAIAGANQKQRFKHNLIMIPVVITGLAIGAFLVGVNAGGISSPVAAVLYWKKRPVTFDFATTGIFWGAFLCASIRIISALTNGRTAYGMGMGCDRISRHSDLLDQ
jgi:hypothetical protein